MKDTYNYPKTLRNYEDNNSLKLRYTTNPPGQLTKSQKSISYSTHRPHRVMQQEIHNIDQYCILTNPSKLQLKQKKNKKNKTKSTKKTESHLSQALKQHLRKPLSINQTQIGSHNIVHCKSLQKLQIISNDRSDQIKRLMQQKGLLIAQNQQLKVKLINPTYRQQQYIQKIAKKQYQIQNLNQNLKRKEQTILEMEKQHRAEIEKLKVKHREEMTSLKEEISELKYNNKISSKDTKTSYNTAREQSNAYQGSSTYKPIKATETVPTIRYTGSTYQPTSYESYSNTQNSNHIYTSNNTTYKSPQTKSYSATSFSKPQTNNTENNYQKRTVHSTNYGQYLNNSYNKEQNKIYQATTSQNNKRISPEKKYQSNRISPPKNQNKQNYKTYVGEDGYERRIYYKQGQQQIHENTKTAQSYKIQSSYQPSQKSTYFQGTINNPSNQTSTYKTHQNQKNIRFTNERIINNLNPVSETQSNYNSKYVSVYKYGGNQNNKEKQSYGDSKIDNVTFGDHHNLYSNSLTFQAFDKYI